MSGTGGLGPATFKVTGTDGVNGVMEKGTAVGSIAGMKGLKNGKGPATTPANGNQAQTGSSAGEFGLLDSKPAMASGAKFGGGLPL